MQSRKSKIIIFAAATLLIAAILGAFSEADVKQYQGLVASKSSVGESVNKAEKTTEQPAPESNTAIPQAEYKKYAPKFTASRYDPQAWVKLAKEAGMKYIVITAKHHEGFCLYDSKVTDWDVMASAAKRDLLKPLVDEARKEGLNASNKQSLGCCFV